MKKRVRMKFVAIICACITVTFSASQGPQQCTYSHWVEVVSFVCADCGYVIGNDTYQHEKHTLCGVNY